MIRSRPLQRRSLLLVTAAALAAAAVLPGMAQEETAKSSKLFVLLETQGRLSYAGDPNPITLLFKNIGDAPWVNPGLRLEEGLQVFDDGGKKLKRADLPESSKDGQPRLLEPNAYFGKVIDLTALFPDTRAIGSYRITWSGPEGEEQSVVSRVIRRYDRDLDYQGVIETEFGRIVLEFYKDLAPMHVKNFIDLANQGFYDGKLFHRTIKGEAIFGGSPSGDERGPGYDIPAEPNGLKVLAGSVAQVSNRTTGLNESGSIFMIAATEQQGLENRFTVFARVVEGLETVKAITNQPNIGGDARIASRPIRDVVMKKVEIREKK
jgi:cyclophilin family peptidyl-prolyl cis-trans isomerase